MGQTLTHGIYLPDEGERNCYSGLAANWQILDTSVGTIAEHTTALSGKAPLVHTHTVSQITNFPAYGNAAGTICEGNDSRLSDARTPVAHTHLTADVTDLLNTSHEWTKVQTYSDANAIIIKNNYIERGNEPSSYYEQRFLFRDKNNQQIAAIKYQNQLSSVGNFINGLEFSITDKFKDGARDATGTAITANLRIGLWNDGTKYIYNECRWRSNLLPFGNNTNDLGSSSYQWNNVYANRVNTQTLNGINPGALSLPDYSHPLVLDVTAQGLNWHKDTTPNFYEIPANGYFAVIVQCPNTANGVLDIFVNNTGIGSSDHGTYTGNELFCYVPVIKGQIVRVRARCDNYYSVAFYPCLGNV